jgi:hypothetical protein
MASTRSTCQREQPASAFHRSGKLQLPISLSYHSSGIKVDQEATSVGLGWTLHAGGSIARIVRDVEDQNDPYGFLYTGANLPNINPIEGTVVAGGYADNSSMLQWFKNAKDKDPDLFNMTTNALSAQFSLDNHGKYVSATLDSLDFNVDISNRTIIVRDRTGNIYRFGKSLANVNAYEETSTLIQGSAKQYLSGFHLTEMISADLADTISFSYKTNSYNENRIISSTRRVLNAGLGLSMIDQVGVNFEGISHNYLSTTIPNAQIIDRITFRNGYIQFESPEDRQDISNASISTPSKARIKGFSVFDRSGSLIQSVLFENNDYFDRTGVGSAIDGYKTPTAQERKSLKLNAVKFLDNTGAFVNDYQIEYDTVPLPPRNTASQDFWGYFNGSGSQTIIPKTFYQNSATGKPEYYGEDRNTDFNYMKAASLRKVKFPTGGYNIYDYEPNYYLLPQQAQNQLEQDVHVSVLAADRLTTCDPSYMAGASSIGSVDFTVDRPLGNNGTANLYVMFSDFLVPNGQKMTFKLIDLTSSISHDFERTMSSSNQPLVFNQSVTLQEGRTYRLLANTNGVKGSNMSMCNSPYIQAGITYRSWVPSTANQVLPKQAGGLRIKSVSSFDNGQLIGKKSYEYGEGGYGANNIGVGTLITDPSKNYYNYPLLYFHLPSQASLKNVLWFTSDSQIELGQNGGNPVSYAKVTEKQLNALDQSSNGKTEYYFDNVVRFSDPKSSTYFPYEMAMFPTWGSSGDLTKKKTYLQSGQSYIPLQTVEYTYGQTVEKRIKTLRNFEVEPDVYNAHTNGQGGLGYIDNNPQRFYRYNYFISRGRKLKTREVVKNYVGGIQVDSTERTFQYSPYYDIKKESYLNSRSEMVELSHKYTSDLDYPILKAKNIVSLPVQTEQTTSGKVGEGTINKYNNDGLLTETYRALTGSSPGAYTSASSVPGYYQLDRTLGYEDLYRNIRSVTPAHGPPTLFLWSYHNMYPIAEIKGSDYPTVEGLLGAGAIASFGKRANPSATDIQNLLSPLRSPSSGAHVTSYTYRPLVGMASQTDPKDMTTYYEYDSFQRLQNIKDQGGNIVKNYAYNYANNQTVAPVVSYQSQERSQPYTKSDCPSGQYGTSVTYTVEAKKYSSTISQADADAKASSDLAANGQKNANLLGGCSLTAPPVVFYNVIKTEYRTRNNCPSGQSSAPVLYTVAANTYSAPTQAAADQLALDDIAANAQAYANSTGSCSIGGGTTTYYNVALTIPSVRNNCTSGLNGSPVNYTVAAGTYSSTISQVDADQKAMADVNANGQAYANTYGSCTTAPPGGFNFIVSTPVPSFLKFIFSYASTGGSVEYEIWGQDKTILIPGSGTGSVTIIDVDSQPSTFSFNLNGVVMSGSGTTTFNNVSFNGPVTFTAQRTSPYYFYNQAKTGQAAKLCPTGQTGERVTYTVPAGKHASLISMADANQMAQNDINANVQAYANANGGCALNLTLNYSTPVDTTTRISINDFAQSKHYVVSGSGTLTDISPWDVIIDVVPTPLFGVQYFYSLGSFPVTSYSSYTTFGTVRLTSGMTLSVTSNQVFKNSGVSVTRTKDNCPSGQLGSAVHYFVGPNVYSSTISQADADAKAQADIDANAQAYANANGTCTPITYYNVQQSVSKTRNDCDPGYIGSEETFVVYAGNYSSQISQADADAKAMAYANAQAQNYANENGTCNLPVVYYATPKFATKTRNNCAGGLAGSQVTYGSHYGGQTYTSLISQADADAKAQANVDANAQNYANAVGTCGVVYRNTFQTAAFTRNNCGSGLRGEGIIYYAVQANTYTSTISQADANAQALADIAANGQNNANNLGNCVSTTSSISYNNPSGGTFRIQISNVLTGTVTNYTITASSGTISGIPSGNSYVSVFDLNEWEFTAAFNGSTTIAGGGSSETPATQIHFSMINLKGTMVLELNY